VACHGAGRRRRWGRHTIIIFWAKSDRVVSDAAGSRGARRDAGTRSVGPTARSAAYVGPTKRISDSEKPTAPSSTLFRPAPRRVGPHGPARKPRCGGAPLRIPPVLHPQESISAAAAAGAAVVAAAAAATAPAPRPPVAGNQNTASRSLPFPGAPRVRVSVVACFAAGPIVHSTRASIAVPPRAANAATGRHRYLICAGPGRELADCALGPGRAGNDVGTAVRG